MTAINEYILRGPRVIPLTLDTITQTACKVIDILNISTKTISDIDMFIEDLWSDHSINVEIIDDSEWMDVVDALCRPSQFTIAMPEKLYLSLLAGDNIQSFFVFFHELGHLLLGHEPVLHHSTIKPTMYEDAEWQADVFADVILNHLTGECHDQLTLSLE